MVLYLAKAATNYAVTYLKHVDQDRCSSHWLWEGYSPADGLIFPCLLFNVSGRCHKAQASFDSVNKHQCLCVCVCSCAFLCVCVFMSCVKNTLRLNIKKIKY